MVKIWISDNTLNSTVIPVGRLDIKGQIDGKTTMKGSRQGHNADRAEQDKEEEDGFAFLTSACMVTSGEAVLGTVKWYLDSGATDHIVKVANYFKESRKLDKPQD